MRLGSKHSALRARGAGAPQEGLVAKARALAAEGLTARHWVGGYGFPPRTATGSAQRDVCLLEGCVGVGEVAVSDHRGSAPSPLELGRLARRAASLLGALALSPARDPQACSSLSRRPAPGAVARMPSRHAAPPPARRAPPLSPPRAQRGARGRDARRLCRPDLLPHGHRADAPGPAPCRSGGRARPAQVTLRHNVIICFINYALE